VEESLGAATLGQQFGRSRRWSAGPPTPAMFRSADIGAKDCSNDNCMDGLHRGSDGKLRCVSPNHSCAQHPGVKLPQGRCQVNTVCAAEAYCADSKQ
jgi:hypothetical protein